VRPASKDEQKYLDMAELYAGKAVHCHSLNLLTETANHLGSTMESLLRIRYGMSWKLNDLVKRFDGDDLFNSMIMHDGASPLTWHCRESLSMRIRTALSGTGGSFRKSTLSQPPADCPWSAWRNPDWPFVDAEFASTA
jgi:hypothetical protein